MTAKEQQLTELLALSSRSITHLTAAITSMSFDLLRSTEPSTRAAGSRMIARMEAVSKELDRQWKLIGDLTEEPPARTAVIEEVQLRSVT
ncbi:MAG TPA: hypothetical protein VLG17_06230 [Pseudomonas sp.]|jgi:hypothetical protein|uniref:hypothetical protein n=1 Tax=Pseudomonas sp. TaxID=306 RepID=UPI00261B7784|nr:hypothetical protein [Pseudomonas sp.]HSX87581.1 hypothetical protein [Pseudomonas sp.]